MVVVGVPVVVVDVARAVHLVAVVVVVEPGGHPRSGFDRHTVAAIDQPGDDVGGEGDAALVAGLPRTVDAHRRRR